MPRLIDDIRASGKLAMPRVISPAKQAEWALHTEQLWQFLREDMPIIRIDNVADYYFTGTDQEQWDIVRDFPNLAPPFEMAWFEHHMSRVIHSREKGDTHVDEFAPRGRVGCLMLAADRESVEGQDLPPNMHWALTIEIFIDYGIKGIIEGPHESIHMAIDADGQLIGNPWMQTFSTQELTEIMLSLMAWTLPMLLAISFMHCKSDRDR
jgi:hypothetical protein